MSQDWNQIARDSGIKIGTMVRSYDFAYDNANYIEGRVVAIAPWEGCPCGNDHVHIQVVRQFMGCNACNNKGWTGEIPNMSVCDSCEGKGNRELPPMNSMIYPMISHLKPRGLYVTPGIQGSELGPGIVKSYAGVVGKTGITITLNYP
tara:strand:+ start:236 stop:679 length:444 start_codon:yes stop_codon:yes gene_type:complete